jgi:hypothetical protein
LDILCDSSVFSAIHPISFRWCQAVSWKFWSVASNFGIYSSCRYDLVGGLEHVWKIVPFSWVGKFVSPTMNFPSYWEVHHPTRWCASSLAKLVPITPTTMVYGRYNASIPGVYKPT